MSQRLIIWQALLSATLRREKGAAFAAVSRTEGWQEFHTVSHHVTKLQYGVAGIPHIHLQYEEHRDEGGP